MLDTYPYRVLFGFKLFFCFTLLFIATTGKTQQKLDFSYTENNQVFPIDTSSLASFHRYRIDNAYLWLGNNGLNNYSLVFNEDKVQRFEWSQVLKKDTALYQRKYNVSKPFTFAKYVQGARQEQYLEVLHTQNFSKNGNFSLGYHKINSVGSYVHQKTNNNNLYANVWWKNPSQKYEIALYANRIKNTMQQNGGIKNKYNFIADSSLFTNRMTIAVNLNYAEEKVTQNQLEVEQKVTLKNKLDSLDNGTKITLKSNTRFYHAKRFYFDTVQDFYFYDSVYINDFRTNDSTVIHQLSQEIYFDFYKNKEANTTVLQPFLVYSYLDYRQNSILNYYHNTHTGLRVDMQKQKYNLTAKGAYFLAGYRAGNYNLNTKIKYNLTAKTQMGTAIYWAQTAPSLDLQYYAGNHNKWNNNFKDINTLSAKVWLEAKALKLKAIVSYNNIENPIYFNHYQMPTQHNGVAQIIKTDIEKTLELKKLKITPKVTYQYWGGKNIYRLPEYFASLRIGYPFSMFKQALKLYVGTKITYYTNIQLMGYSPAIGQYYLVNGGETGNYPFVDLFVNTRIKSVRLFFALTHLNQGFSNENNYFGAVNYPLEDRAYKIGINWNFLN